MFLWVFEFNKNNINIFVLTLSLPQVNDWGLVAWGAFQFLAFLISNVGGRAFQESRNSVWKSFPSCILDPSRILWSWNLVSNVLYSQIALVRPGFRSRNLAPNVVFPGNSGSWFRTCTITHSWKFELFNTMQFCFCFSFREKQNCKTIICVNVFYFGKKWKRKCKPGYPLFLLFFSFIFVVWWFSGFWLCFQFCCCSLSRSFALTIVTTTQKLRGRACKFGGDHNRINKKNSLCKCLKFCCFGLLCESVRATWLIAFKNTKLLQKLNKILLK